MYPPGRRSEDNVRLIIGGAGPDVLAAFESETGRNVSDDGDKLDRLPEYNDIGIAGGQGFGVGICPTGFLPSGITLLPGTEVPGHDDWGNYQFKEGSIVCYRPPNWMKIGNGVNGLAVNALVSLKYAAFKDEW